jgi:hypothetical protein
METTKRAREIVLAESNPASFEVALCHDVATLEEADEQLRTALVGIVLEFGSSSHMETARLLDSVSSLLEPVDYERWEARGALAPPTEA